jgi:hypothetical protein
VRAEGFRNEIALRLAAGAVVFAALSQAGVERASAQQTQTVSQQSSRSGSSTENNDEDFTRPETSGSITAMRLPGRLGDYFCRSMSWPGVI